jgi:hypothetical protein
MRNILRTQLIISLLIIFLLDTNAIGSKINRKLLDSICQQLIPNFESFKLGNRIFIMKIQQIDTSANRIVFSFSCIYNDFEYRKLKPFSYFTSNLDTIIIINENYKTLNCNLIDSVQNNKFIHKLCRTTNNILDGFVQSEGSTNVVFYDNGKVRKLFYNTDSKLPNEYNIFDPSRKSAIDSISIKVFIQDK